MTISRWTIYQMVTIMILISIAIAVDIFKTDIAVPASSAGTAQTPAIMTALFLLLVTGLLGAYNYFQVKKSQTFLRHRLWQKMHLISPVLFALALIVFFIIVLTSPVANMIQEQRWLFYCLLYGLLYLFQVLILSIIHKAKQQTMPNAYKVLYAALYTFIILVVAIFLI